MSSNVKSVNNKGANTALFVKQYKFLSKRSGKLLHIMQKCVLLQRVFHGIRFKVNERSVVVRQPSFFIVKR